MFGRLRRRLSVRLSVTLASVLLPSLAVVAVLLVLRETQVVDQLVKRNGQTAALAGAAMYSKMLDDAVKSNQLKLEDILDPTYEELKFPDGRTLDDGSPSMMVLTDKRYKTKLSDWTDAHGFQQWEDAILQACGCLFASGIDRRGHVPTTNSYQDFPPKDERTPEGNPIPENIAWNMTKARGKRKYEKQEQIAAAGYLGTPQFPVLIQEYNRDTGQKAYTIAAPIFVQGHHFGAFRIGVSTDRITAQYNEMIRNVSILFGGLSLVTLFTLFLATWQAIRPLSYLTQIVNRLSTTQDMVELGTKIPVTEIGEVGEMTQSVNRLRASLYVSMRRLEDQEEQRPRDTTLHQQITVVGLFLAVLFFGSISHAQTHQEIHYRVFSDAAAMGPPAELYAERLAFITRSTLGTSNEVTLVRFPGIPPVPVLFKGDIVTAVAAGASGGGYDAAYIPGAEMNKTWGFLFNSGIPFGPSLEEYIGFLYGQGLFLVQNAMDKRGVVPVPIVATPEQLSGYFPEPLSDVKGHKGIGLSGLCQQHWVLRFLPPGEDVINAACNELVTTNRIKAKYLTFVRALPGAGSLITAVADGTMNGFEFATPLDDVSQLFKPNSSPATVGLRYVHGPGWHQQFLITWLLLNKGVWDSLSQPQKLLVATVAKESLLSSYADNVSKQGRSLQTIVDNGVVVSRWAPKDLSLLRDVTARVLEERYQDPTVPLVDRAEYKFMMMALNSYIRENSQYWTMRRAPRTPD